MPATSDSCLILGGSRSGKSSHAQSLAESLRERQIFIATAQALDDEMEARIARHVADRGSTWSTVEAPLDLSTAITRHLNKDQAIVIDCLTLWLSNIMHAERDIESETNRLVNAIANADSPLILVSNEVGMGIVPESALGRRFRDAQGFLNKAVAEACEKVVFIAAGLPLRLKG
ncbi:MAG: bifunctional adenosylcobinamide kinase/adenosylcobinamide-phosphate guanylyltransferase [Pseudomonadota bacterium]